MTKVDLLYCIETNHSQREKRKGRNVCQLCNLFAEILVVEGSETDAREVVMRHEGSSAGCTLFMGFHRELAKGSERCER